jgi:hypothetical protein
MYAHYPIHRTESLLGICSMLRKGADASIRSDASLVE